MRNINLSSFFTAVTTAGTPVPLLAKTDRGRHVRGPAALLITARKDKTTANTGNVYFGGRSTQNEVLEPGERISLEVGPGEEINLSEVFVDAANNGDGVGVTISQH
jgi:hypothetical protein